MHCHLQIDFDKDSHFFVGFLLGKKLQRRQKLGSFFFFIIELFKERLNFDQNPDEKMKCFIIPRRGGLPFCV